MLTTPEILMQEGWHYEVVRSEELGVRSYGDDTSDNSYLLTANSKLTYSGVVFNEMKGALSSPDDILGYKLQHATFPQNCYGFQSGGDPEAIPDLTQEKFVAFHQKFYHPSNSYIYLYGDVDIADQLAYLDREYLSKFDKIDVDSTIDLHPRSPK